MSEFDTTRRDFMKVTGISLVASAYPSLIPDVWAATVPDIDVRDRVFITNEDSNTIAVIDPHTNAVETTINLTSFDEDPRPPFRFVTGGTMPIHAAMIHKPLYHGCIDAHGVVPSPMEHCSPRAAAGRATSILSTQ